MLSTKNDAFYDNLKIALNIASMICSMFTLIVLILKYKQSQEDE